MMTTLMVLALGKLFLMSGKKEVKSVKEVQEEK